MKTIKLETEEIFTEEEIDYFREYVNSITSMRGERLEEALSVEIKARLDSKFGPIMELCKIAWEAIPEGLEKIEAKRQLDGLTNEYNVLYQQYLTAKLKAAENSMSKMESILVKLNIINAKRIENGL
jgi:hypothetical protein